jgi:hypothetical protein
VLSELAGGLLLIVAAPAWFTAGCFTLRALLLAKVTFSAAIDRSLTNAKNQAASCDRDPVFVWLRRSWEWWD